MKPDYAGRHNRLLSMIEYADRHPESPVGPLLCVDPRYLLDLLGLAQIMAPAPQRLLTA